MPDLSHHVAMHERLRALLQEEFIGIDPETLRDTLEGISTLPEALGAVIRSYLDDLALAASLGIRLSDMQERLNRIEVRADKKRLLVKDVMERADIKKLNEADFSASLQAVPPGLVVNDELAIPSEYWKPQAPKLDRLGLLGALKAGKDVPGVSLGNGGLTISVRTK